MSKHTVKWADIIAACGNYRDGFVAVFRQYEGQPTDEVVRGKTVMVTVNSFAKHIGVDEATFARWVKKASGSLSARSPRSKNDLTRDVQRAVRHEPDAVVDAIMAAPAETRDRIFHEVKLQRAGIDTSTANRKAAGAHARQATEPIRGAIARTQIVLCVQALVDAKTLLAEAISEGAVDSAAMDQINAAYEDFAITLAEARFAVSS